MATITKRKNGWSVQVRRRGHAPQYKTLPTKAEAQAWARQFDTMADTGQALPDKRPLRGITLGALLQRYCDEVTPRKRGASSEVCRLRKMMRAEICALPVAEMTPKAFADYREMRSREVQPGTVRRELYLLRRILDVAAKDWSLPLVGNPAKMVDAPIVRDARQRRLEPGERERLDFALSRTRNPLLSPIISFAIETAMRRGEILSLRWCDISTENRTAYIALTKNGHARTVPLTDGAMDVLRSLPRTGDRVFPATAEAIRQCWEHAKRRAGLTDLRFHDLRHEALSRFCEMGLTIPELAVISGHRDPRMLFRYAHLRADQLAVKLAGRSWEQSVCSMGDRA